MPAGPSHSTRKALVTALLLGTVVVAPAQANTQLCAQLNHDLAALNASETSYQLQDYERAIAEQARELSLTERDWQEAGCAQMQGGGWDRLCLDLEDTLVRMDRNLAALQRERDDMGWGTQSQRETIERAIIDARCNAPPPQQQEVAAPPVPQGSVAPQPAQVPQQQPLVTTVRPSPPASPPSTEPAPAETAKASPPAPEPALPRSRPPEPGPAKPMTEAQKRVRVVGPTFLPPQEAARDQQAQDQKSDR